MSWETVPLDSVSEVIRGVTFAKADSSSTQIENSLPVLRAGNIQEQIILDDGLVYVSEDKIKDSQLLKMNDIVMCTSSGSSKLVGKSARLKNDWNGSFGAFCAGIRPNPQYVSPSFIFHFLQSPVFRRWTTSSDGVGIKNIRSSDLKAFPIPLPPFAEQKRIATILDKADALRQKRQQALDHLNQLGQSIFYEMFGDPAVNPKKWPTGTIRQLVEEAKYGTSKKANTEGKGMPILRMGNITYDGQIDLSDLKYVEFSKKEFPKYTTKTGDILFNRTNSKELVGKTAVVRQCEPLAIAGYLVRARTNSLANPHYISGYLNSQHGKLTLSKMCNNIVGMANINAQKFQDIKIAIPPVERQNLYAERLDEIEIRKSNHHAASIISEKLFMSLQQRAFRGEL